MKNEELFALTAEELLYRLYHEETVEIYHLNLLNLIVVAHKNDQV